MNFWERFFGNSRSIKGRTTPKASVVIPIGNHIENLAAHENVNLTPCKTLAVIDIPVWVEVAPDLPTETTFENLLWEIEPTGEYVYYLAGDFLKNEKGLLRYSSAKTRVEVLVSYEDDTISVAKHDFVMYAAYSDAAIEDHTDFSDMTINEVNTFITERNAESEFDLSYIKLRDDRSKHGWSYMHCGEQFNLTPTLKISCAVLDETGTDPRLTVITLNSSDPEQKIGPLCEHALELMARYHAIDHHELTGAIRM